MLLFSKTVLCIQDLCLQPENKLWGSSAHRGGKALAVFTRRQTPLMMAHSPWRYLMGCQGLLCTFTHRAPFDLHDTPESGEGKDNYPYYTEGLLQVKHNCPCGSEAVDIPHDLLASEHLLFPLWPGASLLSVHPGEQFNTLATVLFSDGCSGSRMGWPGSHVSCLHRCSSVSFKAKGGIGLTLDVRPTSATDGVFRRP